MRNFASSNKNKSNNLKINKKKMAKETYIIIAILVIGGWLASSTFAVLVGLGFGAYKAFITK